MCFSSRRRSGRSSSRSRFVALRRRDARAAPLSSVKVDGTFGKVVFVAAEPRRPARTWPAGILWVADTVRRPRSVSARAFDREQAHQMVLITKSAAASKSGNRCQARGFLASIRQFFLRRAKLRLTTETRCAPSSCKYRRVSSPISPAPITRTCLSSNRSKILAREVGDRHARKCYSPLVKERSVGHPPGNTRHRRLKDAVRQRAGAVLLVRQLVGLLDLRQKSAARRRPCCRGWRPP